MAQLRHSQSAIEALNTRVLLIAFGNVKQAQAWLRQTGSDFPLLLDPERRAYAAYGLGRSVTGVWSLRVWWAYARLLVTGRRLHGLQGDPYQLGGDFIVDSAGMVRMAYYSRDSADRPAVETLLQVLRQIRVGSSL